MLLPLFIALFVEKMLNQSLQEISILNLHSVGDRREEKVGHEHGEKWVIDLKSTLSINYRIVAVPGIKCSNYIFFLQAEVGCMSQ